MSAQAIAQFREAVNGADWRNADAADFAFDAIWDDDVRTNLDNERSVRDWSMALDDDS